mgnify:CR=1 FL=1
MIDLSQFRFIPGAPAGVCAKLITARYFAGQPCEECQVPITESDGRVWFCSYRLLGKRKRDCAAWHQDCLKSGPVTFAVLQ